MKPATTDTPAATQNFESSTATTPAMRWKSTRFSTDSIAHIDTRLIPAAVRNAGRHGMRSRARWRSSVSRRREVVMPAITVNLLSASRRGNPSFALTKERS